MNNKMFHETNIYIYVFCIFKFYLLFLLFFKVAQKNVLTIPSWFFFYSQRLIQTQIPTNRKKNSTISESLIMKFNYVRMHPQVVSILFCSNHNPQWQDGAIIGGVGELLNRNIQSKSLQIFFQKLISQKLVWNHLQVGYIQVCANHDPMSQGGATTGVNFLHGNI